MVYFSLLLFFHKKSNKENTRKVTKGIRRKVAKQTSNTEITIIFATYN